MLYFSGETAGFYDSDVHAVMPPDAVEITVEERAAALAAMAPGKRIAAGPDGKPLLVDALPTPAEAAALLRRRRDQLLRDSDRTQIPDFPISDEGRAAWAIYRQQLRDLPETITEPAAAVWPTPPAEEGAQP